MNDIFKDAEEEVEIIKEVVEEKKIKIPQISFDDLNEATPIEDEEEKNNILLTQKVLVEQDEDVDSEKLKKFSKNGITKIEFHKKLVYIEKETYSELADLSVYDNKSLNSIINDALKAYTKKRKKVVVEIRKMKEEG